MKPRHILGALLAVALVAIVAWACLTFSVRVAYGAGERIDGFMVLYGHQAKECDGGGDCAIFSEREFKEAVMSILLQSRRGAGERAL